MPYTRITHIQVTETQCLCIQSFWNSTYLLLLLLHSIIMVCTVSKTIFKKWKLSDKAFNVGCGHRKNVVLNTIWQKVKCFIFYSPQAIFGNTRTPCRADWSSKSNNSTSGAKRLGYHWGRVITTRTTEKV
jgi:hypothetical protein